MKAGLNKTIPVQKTFITREEIASEKTIAMTWGGLVTCYRGLRMTRTMRFDGTLQAVIAHPSLCIALCHCGQ